MENLKLFLKFLFFAEIITIFVVIFLHLVHIFAKTPFELDAYWILPILILVIMVMVFITITITSFIFND